MNTFSPLLGNCARVQPTPRSWTRPSKHFLANSGPWRLTLPTQPTTSTQWTNAMSGVTWPRSGQPPPQHDAPAGSGGGVVVRTPRDWSPAGGHLVPGRGDPEATPSRDRPLHHHDSRTCQRGCPRTQRGSGPATLRSQPRLGGERFNRRARRSLGTVERRTHEAGMRRPGGRCRLCRLTPHRRFSRHPVAGRGHQAGESHVMSPTATRSSRQPGRHLPTWHKVAIFDAYRPTDSSRKT